MYSRTAVRIGCKATFYSLLGYSTFSSKYLGPNILSAERSRATCWFGVYM